MKMNRWRLCHRSIVLRSLRFQTSQPKQEPDEEGADRPGTAASADVQIAT